MSESDTGFNHQAAPDVIGSLRDSYPRIHDRLNDGDESAQACLSIIQTAIEHTSHSIDEVLTAYARSSTTSLGIVDAPTRTKVEAIVTAAQREGAELEVSDVAKGELIFTEQDIHERGVEIYRDPDLSEAEKKDQLKSLIRQAKQHRLDVAVEEFIATVQAETMTTDVTADSEEENSTTSSEGPDSTDTPGTTINDSPGSNEPLEATTGQRSTDSSTDGGSPSAVSSSEAGRSNSSVETWSSSPGTGDEATTTPNEEPEKGASNAHSSAQTNSDSVEESSDPRRKTSASDGGTRAEPSDSALWADVTDDSEGTAPSTGGDNSKRQSAGDRADQSDPLSRQGESISPRSTDGQRSQDDGFVSGDNDTADVSSPPGYTPDADPASGDSSISKTRMSSGGGGGSVATNPTAERNYTQPGGSSKKTGPATSGALDDSDSEGREPSEQATGASENGSANPPGVTLENDSAQAPGPANGSQQPSEAGNVTIGSPPSDSDTSEMSSAPASTPDGDLSGDAVQEAVDALGGDAPNRTQRPVTGASPALNDGVRGPGRVQDMMGFEFALGERDASVLDVDVPVEGVVKTGPEEYAAIARVTPRSWVMHSPQKREQIIGRYKSSFLRALDFPVQIISYPTEYKLQEHFEHVQNGHDQVAGGNYSQRLIQVSRMYYPEWMQEFIQGANDIRKREFYILISITEEQIRQRWAGLSTTTQRLLEKPVVGRIARRLKGLDQLDITIEDCLRELDERFDKVERGANGVGLEIERITSRQEMLSVLYHYNNLSRPRTAFSDGPGTWTEHIARDNSGNEPEPDDQGNFD